MASANVITRGHISVRSHLDTCHTDSFGGIGAGKSQWDEAVSRLAFDRMWLTKGDVHVRTHTDRCTHAHTSLV